MLRYFLSAGLLIVSAPAYAQNTRDAELAASDAELNKVYRTLMTQLGKEDQTALRASQRAWLSFRDLDCNVGWADRRDCLIPARTSGSSNFEIHCTGRRLANKLTCRKSDENFPGAVQSGRLARRFR